MKNRRYSWFGVWVMVVIWLAPFSLVSLQSSAGAREDGYELNDWEISRVLDGSLLDVAKFEYPRFFQVFFAGWEKVQATPSGLVDITRVRPMNPGKIDAVLARSVVRAEKEHQILFSVDYHGEIAVFFNGQKVIYHPLEESSNPDLKARHEEISLKLVPGLNEFFLVAKETGAGRWDFICYTDQKTLAPIREYGLIEKVWETEAVFLTPESVLYDQKRDVLYVSSFDMTYNNEESEEKNFTGYISRVTLDGKVENLKWVTNLHAPCGMCLWKDRLYTIERRNLAEIDPDQGKVVKRYPVPGKYFLNDIAVDGSGSIYISDTSPSVAVPGGIFRFKDGVVESWVEDIQLSRANGLYIYNNELLVGCTGDSGLRAVNLETKKIRTVAGLGVGVVDGIRVDSQGNYLVSHWEGKLYRISPGGGVVEILYTLPLSLNLADFEFYQAGHLIIVPTFTANKVVAFKIK